MVKEQLKLKVKKNPKEKFLKAKTFSYSPLIITIKLRAGTLMYEM